MPNDADGIRNEQVRHMQVAGTILGIAVEILIWVTFGADVVPQFAGVCCMLGAAVGALVSPNSSADVVLAALGWLLWFMGHLSYYGSYGEFRSRVAEFLLELMTLPRAPANRPHPRYAGPHAIQQPQGTQRAC